MTKETLFVFLKRLLEDGSRKKSVLSLHQLKEILERQNADPDLIGLIDLAIESVPAKEVFSFSDSLTEEELRIAVKRANDVKRHEAEMRSRGRC